MIRVNRCEEQCRHRDMYEPDVRMQNEDKFKGNLVTLGIIAFGSSVVSESQDYWPDIHVI